MTTDNGQWTTAITLSSIALVTTATLEAGSLPAAAAVLAGWRFDPTAEQLEITVRDGTTPHYFLLDRPPRIVLDLPNTQLGKVATQQNYSGAVRQVRVSQFQPGMTRIVLELSPLVDVDSGQVQLQRSESLAGTGQVGERWLLRTSIADRDTSQEVPTSLPGTLPPATFDTQQVPTVNVPPPDRATANITSPANTDPNATPPTPLGSQVNNAVSVPPPQARPLRGSSNRSNSASMLGTAPRSTDLLSQADKRSVIEFGQPLPEAPQQATAMPLNSSPQAPQQVPVVPPGSLPHLQLQQAAPILPPDTQNSSTLETPAVVVPPLGSTSGQEPTRTSVVSTSNSGPTVSQTTQPDTFLPTGTQLSLRYAGEFSLTLKAGSPLKQVLLLQEDLRDRTGNLIAPADTPVVGLFETNERGSRFIAQAIARPQQNLPLTAQSEILTSPKPATLLPGQVLQIRLTTPLRLSY